MTDLQKVQVLRSIGEFDDDEAVLLAYLGMAGSAIIARCYPFRDDIEVVPARYEFLQIEIAQYLLDKRGAEGQTAHAENGISRYYESASIPESMLKAVTPYCGVMR